VNAGGDGDSKLHAGGFKFPPPPLLSQALLVRGFPLQHSTVCRVSADRTISVS